MYSIYQLTSSAQRKVRLCVFLRLAFMVKVIINNMYIHVCTCTLIYFLVSLHAVNTSYSCYKPLSGFTAQCSSLMCSCPTLPYTCPQDSILLEVRQSNCCVTFQCSCPNDSCPLLADGNQGVYPIAVASGNRFPGTCCPNYTYLGE